MIMVTDDVSQGCIQRPTINLVIIITITITTASKTTNSTKNYYYIQLLLLLLHLFSAVLNHSMTHTHTNNHLYTQRLTQFSCITPLNDAYICIHVSTTTDLDRVTDSRTKHSRKQCTEWEMVRGRRYSSIMYHINSQILSLICTQ